MNRPFEKRWDTLSFGMGRKKMPGYHKNGRESSHLMTYVFLEVKEPGFSDERSEALWWWWKNVKTKLASLKNGKNCWTILCVNFRVTTIYCVLSRLVDFLEKYDMEGEGQCS